MSGRATGSLQRTSIQLSGDQLSGPGLPQGAPAALGLTVQNIWDAAFLIQGTEQRVPILCHTLGCHWDPSAPGLAEWSLSCAYHSARQAAADRGFRDTQSRQAPGKHLRPTVSVLSTQDRRGWRVHHPPGYLAVGWSQASLQLLNAFQAV